MWAKRVRATCAAFVMSTSTALWPAASPLTLFWMVPGADAAVTQALGSRRYQVTITGPGGHSFTDAGTPNPIAALATALAALAETPLPDEPRTTLNLGTIRGGISVNSIPESAQATIDFRSTDADQLVRLEVALHRAVEDAVAHWNERSKSFGSRSESRLSFTISKIGDRPAAQLPDDSPLLAALRAVDRHLGLRTDLRLGSTDANIPLALGVPALSMGAGGEGGAAHTLHEWYSPKDREIALKRVLSAHPGHVGVGGRAVTSARFRDAAALPPCQSCVRTAFSPCAARLTPGSAAFAAAASKFKRVTCRRGTQSQAGTGLANRLY